VMCWLGLEARGQAKPSKIGQAKAKPRAWLTLACGLGLRFSKPWLWSHDRSQKLIDQSTKLCNQTV
jgi:hypothetical protein